MAFHNSRISVSSFYNKGATAFVGGLFLLYCLLVEAVKGPVLYAIITSWLIWSIYSVWVLSRHKNTFSFGFRLLYFLSGIFGEWRMLVKNPEATSTWRAGKRTKNTVLFSLVKIVWLPLMLQFLWSNGNSLFFAFRELITPQNHEPAVVFFNLKIFPLLLSLAFFIDTLFFAFGYLFEAPFLRNTMKSVDSNGWSWLFTLVCYPPFIAFSLQLAPWFSSDLPYFGTEQGTFFVRSILVVLIFIYALSSLFLGSKASNMTNRGIVSRGTYAWVRHPAYASKVLFWWIAAIPGFMVNPKLILFALFWTFIYVMRAFFEERHLIQDAAYRAYCKKVPYRFIPGII